jgi:hypothetical protein
MAIPYFITPWRRLKGSRQDFLIKPCNFIFLYTFRAIFSSATTASPDFKAAKKDKSTIESAGVMDSP